MKTLSEITPDQLTQAIAVAIAQNAVLTTATATKIASDAAAESAKQALVIVAMSKDIEYIRSTLDARSKILDAIPQIYATKVDLEETRREFVKITEEIKRGFVEHNKQDVESFGGLANKVDGINKTIYVASGAILMGVFLIKLLWK